jgi:hypothetical protein
MSGCPPPGTSISTTAADEALIINLLQVILHNNLGCNTTIYTHVKGNNHTNWLAEEAYPLQGHAKACYNKALCIVIGVNGHP